MSHAARRMKGWRRLEVMLDERTMGRLEEICEAKARATMRPTAHAEDCGSNGELDCTC